jgi:nitrile hydratase beta subunit
VNGPQDMGGMMGFGPVRPEVNEPVFHEDWERHVLGLTLAMDACGLWNIDILRHTRECFPAEVYWSVPYYDLRIEAHIKVMLARGLITEAEILAGHMQVPPKPVKAVLKAEKVGPLLAKGSPYIRATEAKPLFKIGDRVKVRNLHPEGHTRLPGYLRGKTGEVVMYHKAHVFPDSNSQGAGENPQHLYAVRFKARDVFGVNTNDDLQADLFEPYLEAP